MQRNQANLILNRIQEILNAGFENDPLLKNYRCVRSGGTYNPHGDDLRTKIQVISKTFKPVVATGDATDTIGLRMGMAPIGTPVLLSNGAKGVIINAKRVNYTVEDIATKKLWRAPFTNVRLDPSRMEKSQQHSGQTKKAADFVGDLVSDEDVDAELAAEIAGEERAAKMMREHGLD